LGDHVLDRRLHRRGSHRVNRAKRETQQTVSRALLELRREILCQFDGLVLDSQTTDSDIVGPDTAGGSGLVAVGDLPGRPRRLVEGARLGRVKDVVGGSAGIRNGRRKLGGPYL